MPWMWRDPLEEAEGWREAEAHWSRFREMWEGVSETGDDALMAAESWRGRSPGSDSPHPHGASWLTSFGVHCGISLLQLLYEQQPHLSLSHIWAKISIYLPTCLSIYSTTALFVQYPSASVYNVPHCTIMLLIMKQFDVSTLCLFSLYFPAHNQPNLCAQVGQEKTFREMFSLWSPHKIMYTIKNIWYFCPIEYIFIDSDVAVGIVVPEEPLQGSRHFTRMHKHNQTKNIQTSAKVWNRQFLMIFL